MRDRKSDSHRKAAALKLGRPLRKGEVVHHRDEDKTNNHPDNLDVQSRGGHTAAHNKGRGVSKLRRALRMPKDRTRLY